MPPPPKTELGPEKRGVVYQRLKYFPGLDETVTIYKAPSHSFARFKSGKKLSLTELRKAEKKAYLKRYSSFLPGLLRSLKKAPADQIQRVAIHYKTDFDWRKFAPDLYDKDQTRARSAQEKLKEAIAKKAKSLTAELVELGLKVNLAGKAMPVLFAEGSPANVLKLRARNDLKLVAANEPLEVELRGSSPSEDCDNGSFTDSISFHKIDTAFNDLGFYGHERKVGIFEESKQCALATDHEAFNDLQGGPHFNNPSPNTDPTSCGNQHARSVASVIAGSVGTEGPRGAAKINLYYPNLGDPNAVAGGGPACNAQATLSSYEWLENQGVKTVNESFGCLAGGQCNLDFARAREGLTQDYFSRNYNMTIVKAAGNQNCEPEQPACPWTLNSICVGGVASNLAMSNTSSYFNLLLNGNLSDREEPDVVTLGGDGSLSDDVCVATPLHGTVGGQGGQGQNPYYEEWVGRSGTSFAAPAVTSMITLFKEACEENHDDFLPPRSLRAITRTMAFAANPADDPYSTPRPTTLSPPYDGKDGGGFLDAELLMLFCEPGGAPGGIQTGIIDLTDPDPGDPPPGSASYRDEHGWHPPGATQFKGPGQKTQDFGYSPGDPGNGRSWKLLRNLGTLAAGTKIRATYSWDACGPNQGSAPGAVGTDFDLFLYKAKPGSEDYVWASQSLDDNNEGFQYTVQAGEEGPFQIILMWDDDSGCDGSQFEPYTLAWGLP